MAKRKIPHETEAKAKEPNLSRRRFLGGAAIAAASAVAGGVGVAAVTLGKQNEETSYGLTPLAARSEPGFDHLVVLMFENRSFDNILGRLYASGAEPKGQKFNGLLQGDYSNTAPDGTVVPAHVYAGGTDHVMGQPNPDPGEFYPHVNTQLFDLVDPLANAELWKNELSAPFNAPADDRNPTMSGFLRDYVINFQHEKRGQQPIFEEYRVAMGGFSPEMLPVMSTLAREFAVYDNWHAAVPSQTLCNRSFFHASNSHGYVTNELNGGIGKWLTADGGTTVFNRLEDAGIPWRVYYDDDQLISLTGFLHAPHLEKYWKSNFRGISQFHADVADGNLPAYSFIEPRMVFNHNDMHPPVGVLRDSIVGGEPIYDSALSDVRAGEALLASIYTAIKNSDSATGSNAINTALLVTFDEHGGIYDHVPPPRTVSPSGQREEGEMGFGFERLGVRVPAILISAYAARGTVVNELMHHSNVIKTLTQLHDLKPLTERDRTGVSIENGLRLTSPRQPALWPDVHASYVPPNPEDDSHGKPHDVFPLRPLTPPAKGLLGLLLAKFDPSAPVPMTYADAYQALTSHGTGLFGVRDT
jgi:phospholipase C